MSSSAAPRIDRTDAAIRVAGPNQTIAVDTRCGCKSNRFPPPSAAVDCSRQDPAVNSGRNLSNLESNLKIFPSTPSLIIFLIVKASLSNFRLKYVVTATPVDLETSIIDWVSANVRPIGLSTTVGIPDRKPAIACSACALFADATTNRSRSSLSKSVNFETTVISGKSFSASALRSALVVKAPTT
ncbi:unannotated protein [freshwater metagenome]|uniref:Unannotated protein n=1 Tax=freshwater metagenome TaxID=449393 RepID=A0A6J6PCB3_9ZZZZ